jgi:DNA primase
MDSSNNQIEEIKDRLDIVNVIEKYVKLKRTGKNYVGLCPFHTEKTPSFVVSPDLQRYKCFGCGETGDIFNFLQDIEGIDFPEALEKLAKEAGVELKKSPYNSKYKVLEEINYKATKYFYNQFKKSSKAQKYMKERGFNENSLKTFGVGYAPKNPKLKDYLAKSKNYTQRELLDSGLFTLKEKKVKEKFYDRIMFPIRSKRGKVLAFTARVLPGNDWGPKYMNSPDTPIFHKKENLFGQYESRQEIRKSDLAIICEGSTDVIAAHQHGVKNIVAPLGTGLTQEQLENLSKITKNFLFFFDSDDAGKNALIRGFKIASELKLVPYAKSPEPYKDIDELLQENPKRMKSLIKNKREAFFFILEDYLADKNLNKLEDLSKVRNFIGSLLFSVKDLDVKKYYSRKAATITKINSFRPPPKRNVNVTKPIVTKNIPVKVEGNKLYRGYLQRLLLLEDIKDEYLLNEKSFEPVNSPDLKRIYKEILSHYKKGREEMYSQLRDNTQITKTFEEIIFDLTNIPTDKESVVEQLKSIIKKIEINNLKAKQKDLSIKVALAEEAGKSKKAEEYLKELTKINNLLKEKEGA